MYHHHHHHLHNEGSMRKDEVNNICTMMPLLQVGRGDVWGRGGEWTNKLCNKEQRTSYHHHTYSKHYKRAIVDHGGGQEWTSPAPPWLPSPIYFIIYVIFYINNILGQFDEFFPGMFIVYFCNLIIFGFFPHLSGVLEFCWPILVLMWNLLIIIIILVHIWFKLNFCSTFWEVFWKTKCSLHFSKCPSFFCFIFPLWIPSECQILPWKKRNKLMMR
jgi:hypothetical protein